MRMLYKFPGPHEIQGRYFDWLIVPDTAQSIAQAESEGWRRTTDEAYALAQEPAPIVPAEPDQAVAQPAAQELTEAELVELAQSLGVKVDRRWSVARLKAEIDKADGRGD